MSPDQSTAARPPLGNIQPGDPVVVIDPDQRGAQTAAHIAKAARVWLEIQADDSLRRWRMRRDTQNENTGFGYGGHRFVTVEQHSWDRRFEEATAYLADLGIMFHPGRKWSAPERRIRLADMIRALADGSAE
nr:hypothetical protein KPHV_85850 [Kitasatospora purpeofusca]